MPDLQHDQEHLRSHRPMEKQNLIVMRYKKQYTSGTVPSFYTFRQITFNTSNNATFS